MAFSDFRYPDVLSAFDLRDDVASDLFAGVAPIAPGPISQTGVEVGARVNERAGAPVDPVYGCVTTGSFWRFLRLSGRTLPMDFQEYSLRQTDRLLGNLTHMLGPVPTPAAA